MAGRLGGYVVGAAAVLAAAMTQVPPSSLPSARVAIDFGTETGGTVWARAETLSRGIILDLAAALAFPDAAGRDHQSARIVEQRLRNGLTPEIAKYFRLFLYVDKSARGDFSQHMWVFENRGAGNLHLRYVWPVSTGREQLETDATGQRVLTTTPAGYYELDPGRLYRRYRSGHWNEAMPYAMFFNRVENGVKTGLAIHGAAGGERNLLGQRASAGCVRLAPENARRLFALVRDHEGRVPALAFDRGSANPFSAWAFRRMDKGQFALVAGYQVLVLIDQPHEGKDLAALL